MPACLAQQKDEYHHYVISTAEGDLKILRGFSGEGPDNAGPNMINGQYSIVGGDFGMD
jgi:hypothetical protein